MKTEVFYNKLSSKVIQENIAKQFGTRVNLNKYSREQLEDMRNKLRTQVFQQEGSSGINDLLTNETYQKNKAMLELLNTRIKEMLGEDIKKLKDKLTELSEGKKGVKVAKHPRPSKGSGDGNLANNYPPYDKVTRGDVVAGALGKDQKGGKVKEDGSREKPQSPFAATKPGEYKSQVPPKAGDTHTTARGHKVTKTATGVKHTTEAADKCAHNKKGKPCPVHGLDECPMEEGKAVSQAQQQAAGAAYQAKKTGKTPPAKQPSAAMSKMSKKELKTMASTKHEGLPKKKKKTDEATQIYRRHVKIVNESLAYLLSEDEEEKAQAITAAGDMANDFTSWMQRVGQYQTKVMIELSDEIRHNFGAQQAEAFKQAVGPALSATLETLTAQREAISNAIAVLAGEQMPTPEPMGAEPGAELPPEPGMEPAEPDTMNEPAGDEFAASEPASTGREMRESKFARKLAESHSIMAKLAR